MDIQKIIKGDRHSNYTETCELAHKLRVHSDGLLPEKLINERRPSESEEVKKYRRKIYVAKTKNPIFKVVSSLEKIRRSQDWSIQYNAESVPKNVTEKEHLEQYCEYNYPIYTSITNWAFSVLLKQYLIDANGIVAIIPETIPKEKTEYIKPIAVFFESSQVMNYKEGEMVVLKSLDTSSYQVGQLTQNDGSVYYQITTTNIIRYEQINNAGDLKIVYDYQHNLGKLPAFKVGGLFLKRKNNDTIYESRIASMLPNLDEAAREYSDLQAEIVQHIHSEKYAYTNEECKECRGTGRVESKTDNKQVECSRCKGSGTVLNSSPYGMYLIRQEKDALNNSFPTPPIGYVQKSVEMARLQDERVSKHIYEALATINMEFLANTPLNQSGVAKEVDRDELNNFVNSIAEDIVAILDKVYYFINEYRYFVIVGNAEQRQAMLPKINVPTKYDLLTSEHLLVGIEMAKKSGVSSVILRELEIEYAKKRFYTNQDISYEVQAVIELDPLYGMSIDEKMSYKANGGVSEEDYIISCNISNLVREAKEKHSNFYSLPRTKQKEIIQSLVLSS